MCFKSTKFPKLRIAKRNIPCYKVLSKDLSSPFMLEEYVVNEIKETSLGRIERDYLNDTYDIEEGLHSYTSNCKFVELDCGYFFQVKTKFDKEIMIYGDFYKVFKSIIPKGARYYCNNAGEYVSDKLIVLNDCKLY